ncbi:MAG: hypothetical protein JWR80_6833 [Bradyrhizobium sp.]|nr:hypothetical protein [Bradyrhizobium sp.]
MAAHANNQCDLPSQPPIERRENERYATIYRVARVVNERGHQQLCLIRNISSGGLLLETYAQLAEGDRLRIEPKTGDCLTAVVSWSQPHLAGVTFTEPLDVAAFLSAEQRGGSQYAPRSPRIEAQCRARLQVGPAWQEVRLRDLSQGGAKIACDAPIPVGERVVLQVEDLDPIAGQVRWAREGQIGLTFSSAIPFGDLSQWTDRRDGETG